MKSFLRAVKISGKRLALFGGGMEADPIKRHAEIQAAFPPELLSQAVAVAFCGGRFQFGAMNATERFLIRRISKTKTDVDAIDDHAIAALIAAMKAS
jgi:menaquinone-dependent protoporphyrinogen oxidase